MTIDPTQLRKDFSEFKDQDRYPDGLLQFWLTIAYSLLNASRWGSTLDLAAELFACHNVVIERRAQDEAEADAPPGVSTGPVTAKSVDKASVSYSSADALEKEAGHWNLTIYGTRLRRMMGMFGAGPIQVGPGGFGPCGFFNQGAWAGPPFWPGWYWGT